MITAACILGQRPEAPGVGRCCQNDMQCATAGGRARWGGPGVLGPTMPMSSELWRWNKGALLWRRSRVGCPVEGADVELRSSPATGQGYLWEVPEFGTVATRHRPTEDTVSLAGEPHFPVCTHVFPNLSP